MRRTIGHLNTPAGYFLLACAAMGLLWSPVVASVLLGQDIASTKTQSSVASVPDDAGSVMNAAADRDPLGALDDLTWKRRLTP
ncbi:hypothetical protein [Jannaschia ovalis]|uniref:Uncharacterized protein n=1 Tax=Jannaschia ovalis TaxID=3038773 RepID=A0ABY8LC73_9RHOB|nr:hypothetical protein [Jannaschia sp. GRR-S6-38]WGH77788.1 hypothetical protein P8627_12190 [Jannaschia sp. GRR-S6-38]